MPVSTSAHITDCLGRIVRLAPASVLDVGCGFGMWGFLCRTYLDVFQERFRPEDWQVRIDGLELFDPYIQAHQRALYTSIRIADIRAAAETLDEYDLIIAGDVIEHLDKDDAERVLDVLYAKARRALLVNIPLGETGWEHPENHGNPGELHRSAWSVEDFLPFPNERTEYALPNGAYGVFWCPKDAAPASRVAGLLVSAQRAAEAGRTRRALALLRALRPLAPGDATAAILHADCALREGLFDEGVRALEDSLSDGPESHANYVMLARLLRQLSRADTARVVLDRLLALDNVGEELRDTARALRA